MTPAIAKVMSVVACPHCRREELQVQDGQLICACGRRYPLRGAVPDFSGGEIAAVEGFQFQWEERRAGGFESVTLYGKTAEDEEAQFYRYLGLAPGDTRGKRVLDAGCGSGRLVMLLAQHQVDVVGIDLTENVFVIEREIHSRQWDTASLVRGNLRAIPLRSGTFDYVWSGGVIHHTGNTREALHNLVRVLKPGGTLYVWVYSVDQGIFGRIRQVLPFVHHLPKPLLLALCRMLAVPVFVLGQVTGRPRGLAEVRFKLFDHLAPQYRTVHSEAEMRGWFEAEGLENVEIVIPQRTGGVGIRGRKRA